MSVLVFSAQIQSVDATIAASFAACDQRADVSVFRHQPRDRLLERLVDVALARGVDRGRLGDIEEAAKAISESVRTAERLSGYRIGTAPGAGDGGEGDG